MEPRVAQGLSLLTFIAILWLTEALPVMITALLVPAMGMMMGLMPGKAAMVSFADPIIFLFFGGFTLAGALKEQGIDVWLAGKIIHFSKGRLGIALGLIFVVTAILSMWMSNTATAAMMIPLTMGLMAGVDTDKYRSTWIFAILGVAYSASIGGMGTLVGSPPNAIAAQALNMNFLDWFMIGFPISIVFGFIVLGLMWLMYRPALTLNLSLPPSQDHQTSNQSNGLSSKQKMVLGLFSLIALSWMSSSFISSACGGIADIDSLIAILAVILLVFTKSITWKGIVNNTDWGVLILFGGGITLSKILMDTGAGHFLAVQITEGFGHFGIFVFLLAVSAFISFLTEFCSNTASAALVVPLMVSIAPELGISDQPLVLLIGIGASCAFMLPVSTPPNAIAFATGKIPQFSMIKMGLTIDLILIFVKAAWAYFFWM